MKQGTLEPLRILRRVSAALGIGATINTFARALGHSRVVGQFACTTGTALAVGFPRVRFSNDGTTFQVVRLVAIDAAASAAAGMDVYPFDLPVEGPYVAVELTNGGVGAAAASAWAELRPE